MELRQLAAIAMHTRARRASAKVFALGVATLARAWIAGGLSTLTASAVWRRQLHLVKQVPFDASEERDIEVPRLRPLMLRYFSPEGTKANSPGPSAPGKLPQIASGSPGGATADCTHSARRPSGASWCNLWPYLHGLKPVANRLRPFGTEIAQLQNLRFGLGSCSRKACSQNL